MDMIRLASSALLALCFLGSPVFGQPIPPTKDKHGDLLPAGAVGRLGSIRWRHSAPVYYVAFAPDGKSVISAGDDGLFRVWEYPSGKELRRFGPAWPEQFESEAGSRTIWYRVFPLPFSVSKDGKRAAVFGGTKIAVYDVATGDERNVLQLPDGEENAHLDILAVAFSFDGQQLAALARGGTVYLWDMASAKLMRNIGGQAAELYASALAFAPDGKVLVTTTEEGDGDKAHYTLQMWDTATGHNVRAAPLPLKTGFRSADFTPDGKLIALVCHDGNVLLVDSQTGKLVRRLEWETVFATPPLFARDGKTLFRRLTTVTIGEWDVATGKPLRQFGPNADANPNEQYWYSDAPLALSPDGLTLAVCGVDNRVHFFDVAAGKERSLGGRTWAIDWLQFAPDGNRLWSSDVNQRIRLWDYSTAKELDPPRFPTESYLTLVSSDGRVAIQRNPRWSKGFIAIDLVFQRETNLNWPMDDRVHNPHTLALAPDGKTLAIRWYKNQKLELYDVPALQLRHTLAIHTGVVEDGQEILPDSEAKGVMIYSRDGRWLAAYSDPQTITVWNTLTGKKMTAPPLPVGAFAFNGAFTPDGRCLVLDFEDGTVHLIELATAQARRVFGVKVARSTNTPFTGGWLERSGPALAQSAKVAVTPDGRMLVHGGPDKVVRVYDVFTGKELAHFQGHEGAILAVAVSNDGKYAATASTDTTVLLWKLPTVPATGAKGK